MKKRLVVFALLLGAFVVCARKDARGGTENVQKTIQTASSVLLGGSATDDQMRGALIQLLDAVVVTLPRSEHAAEARSNLEAARAELTGGAFFTEKGHRHLALAYLVLSGGKPFEFPDVHTIEDAKTHVRKLLASAVDSLNQGQEGLASRFLLECVVTVVTPMSR